MVILTAVKITLMVEAYRTRHAACGGGGHQAACAGGKIVPSTARPHQGRDVRFSFHETVTLNSLHN